MQILKQLNHLQIWPHLLKQQSILYKLYNKSAGNKNVSELSLVLNEYLKPRLSEFSRILSDISQILSSGSNKDIKLCLERKTKLQLLFTLKDKLDAITLMDQDSIKMMEELDDGTDLNLRELDKSETETRLIERAHLESELSDLILPPDNFAGCSSVEMGFIAGAGGFEAAMFARDLYSMYQAYSKEQGWRFTPQDAAGSEAESEKNTPISYTAVIIDSPEPTEAVYSKLRWEAGVHRVQRIPTNSKLNKIHTSTVAITILPVMLDDSLHINPEDLEWEVFRSSGAGGQHVNKTESAVRVRHKPSGFVAVCQENRSQHANRKGALQLLMSKLSKESLKLRVASDNAERKSQMGSLARSDRIRTYNYPQDRITDHRLMRSFNNLKTFMQCPKDLNSISLHLDKIFKIESLKQYKEKPHFLL